MEGADKIVGVDLNDSQEEWGGRFQLAASCGVTAGGDNHPWSYNRSDQFATFGTGARAGAVPQWRLKHSNRSRDCHATPSSAPGV